MKTNRDIMKQQSRKSQAAAIVVIAFFAISVSIHVARADTVYSFQSIAALRAFDTSGFGATSPQANTSGYFSPGDGGGNQFSWSGSSTAVDNNGAIIKPTAVASTSPGRWLATVTDILNVKAFGAVADDSTDSTTAIQAAIDAAPAIGGQVFIPPGAYKVTTINITNPNKVVRLAGLDASVGGSQLRTEANAPLLKITMRCTVEGIAFKGSYNASYTNQDLILVDDVNDVYLRNLFLNIGYNNIRFNNTCFYAYLDNVRFYDAVYSELRMTGTSSAGAAIQLNNCQVTGGTFPSAYGFLLDNVGSLMIDNLMFNHRNITSCGVRINTVAPGYGATYINNSVIEVENAAPALSLLGTNDKWVTRFFAANCAFGGGNVSGSKVVELGYVAQSGFSNCYVYGADGTNNIYFKNKVVATYFRGMTFDGTGYPFLADTYGTQVEDISIDHAVWGSTVQPLIYLHSATPMVLGNVTIRDSMLGNKAALSWTIDRPTLLSGKTVTIDCPGYNKGKLAAPTVPLSNHRIQNPFDVPVTIYIKPAIAVANAFINGESTDSPSAVLRVPAGGDVAISYGAPVTWTWFGD